MIATTASILKQLVKCYDYVPIFSDSDTCCKQVVDTPGTFGEVPLHAKAGPIDITLPESVVNPSTSNHEEPESDNDVPYFSDIEAMVNLQTFVFYVWLFSK